MSVGCEWQLSMTMIHQICIFIPLVCTLWGWASHVTSTNTHDKSKSEKSSKKTYQTFKNKKGKTFNEAFPVLSL